jgi:hypothetical protein
MRASDRSELEPHFIEPLLAMSRTIPLFSHTPFRNTSGSFYGIISKYLINSRFLLIEKAFVCDTYFIVIPVGSVLC